MEFKLDFTEVSSPTAKQIDLVQVMCTVLHIDKPKTYDFDSYSDFISDNIDEYQCECYEQFGHNY